MAKKKNNQSAKPLKPEEYIRKKARNLPIYKCYRLDNSFEYREMVIMVVRRHTQGTFTFASYMIDKWCLGVKDSMWQFNVSERELEDYLSHFEKCIGMMEDIDYVEAHNWVYGAVAFAEDAGIKPCKEFALTRYILEEDDDNVELIEYDFGRDGEYCLVAKDRQEAARYISSLDKNIGRGNYSVEIGPGCDEWEEDENWDDGDNRWFGKWKITPSMEYTYKGKDYPTEVVLNHPEVKDILLKDTDNITDGDIEKVLSLPADTLREDLHNLVIRELGRQWGKKPNELGEGESDNWSITGNAFMFLTKVGTVEETLPIVLEVMRQGREFMVYNFGDCADLLLDPILCVLVKDNPRLLKSYLLEPGLYAHFKISALVLLGYIAQHCPESRQEIIDMTAEVLNEYKRDLPQRKICDGGVTAFAITILVGAGAVEQLPLIEEIYATGLVDESVEGHIEEVRERIQRPKIIFPLPPMEPYKILDKYKKMGKIE